LELQQHFINFPLEIFHLLRVLLRFFLFLSPLLHEEANLVLFLGEVGPWDLLLLLCFAAAGSS
jgi:ABC-type polysaccharide/polyol phosphate export permease